MRLEKYLAISGIASRRAAQGYIKAGRITVNGESVLIPGTPVEPDEDLIEVDGQPIGGTPKRIYLMLNKPPGYVTTRCDERGRSTVMELVRDIPESIYPVGRLDLDTEGLLIMTNDGGFAYRLTHPRHEVQKTYVAWVAGQPSQKAVNQLRRGVQIEGGCTSPASLTSVGQRKESTQFKVIIHEGKKRQIRRMFQVVGHRVISLKRIGIGSLSLGDLPIGQYRLLTPTEIDDLRA